jgi:DNA adenine methylase
MSTYTCEKCDRQFNQKSHFDKHCARKRACKKDATIEKRIENRVREEVAKITNTIIVPQPLANTKITKPLIKWVGGKTQIIENVLEEFPKEMVNYYEPFLGGGSVLLALLSKRRAATIKVSGTIYASDFNRNLIGLYKNIQTSPRELQVELKKISDEYMAITVLKGNKKPSNPEESKTSREAYYYWTRGLFNAMTAEEKVSILGSAIFTFMNKAGFHGMYREDKKGNFNIPFGGAKGLSLPSDAHMAEVSSLIKDVVFTHCSFTDALARATRGDFIYMDPPYAPESATSFVGYTADGFDIKKHETLFKTCSSMKTLGIKMLMSNANVKLVRDAFPLGQFETKEITCRRACNAKDPGATTTEVLIKN